jgi:hypothetical protein
MADRQVMEQNPRLDGWKEIAAYLRRDERTVQRWEKERNLPIRRSPGGRRGVVVAYAAELDSWLAGNPNGLDPVPQGIETPLHLPVSGASHWYSYFLRSKLLVGSVMGIILLVSFIVLAKPFASNEVASVSLRSFGLEARDASGRLLWTHLLASPLPIEPGPRLPTVRYVGNLSGDGRTGVLVSMPDGVVAGTNNIIEREVSSFSHTGKVEWKYRFSDTVQFGAGRFGPPWSIGASTVYQLEGQTRFALAFWHEVWWPSAVVILDGNGHEVGRFVNSGYVLQLEEMETRKGPLLLAEGINNGFDRSASLAVLDAAHPSGSSPQPPNSPFECNSCPAGRPLRYIVFPRSELSFVAPTTYNRVRAVRMLQDGIEVETQESQIRDAEAIYEFTPDFHLKRAAYSDSYWEHHRELERGGKIHHSRAECPDRDGPRKILLWDPDQGWLTIIPTETQRMSASPQPLHSH